MSETVSPLKQYLTHLHYMVKMCTVFYCNLCKPVELACLITLEQANQLPYQLFHVTYMPPLHHVLGVGL